MYAYPRVYADTHRWTVFLASAATPPPIQKNLKGKGKARYEGEGYVEEGVDFITGGADDLSWLIKRVTFRLHETYPQPNRGELLCLDALFGCSVWMLCLDALLGCSAWFD